MPDQLAQEGRPLTHSVELLPDAAAAARIRTQWTALLDAGLPSGGRIAAPTNRPHLTLLAAPAVDAGARAALTPVTMRLPLTCTLGAPILFADGSLWTLARLVVPSAELLSVHATAVRLVTPLLSATPYSHCTPGSWTPHLTLARRMTPAQVAEALSIVDATPSPITFDALRLWDGDAHTEDIQNGRAC